MGAVADLTGVSPPTVRRASAAEGILSAATPGGHRRFSPAQVDQLISRLGRTPVLEGFTRPQSQVLAAFATHPFGFRSMRAVARATTLSPTAAGRAVQVLVERGLITAAVETVAEGTARDVECWRLRVDRPWFHIAATVSQTVLPAPRTQGVPPQPVRIPRRFWHLFWDVDPATLTVSDDGDFIATRLVLGPDLIARSWALRNLPQAALEHAATNRAAGPSLRAMIQNALAA